MWFSDYEMERYRLKKNDIVVSEGGEIGRAALWANELQQCFIQNSVHKVTCFASMEPYCLLYQFGAAGYIGHFDKIVNRVSIAHLTKEKLVDVYFAKPPIEEQNEISNYLKTFTDKIDSLIHNIEKQIDQLDEIRKIEIYNAVTGKIKVV
jgi:type I restriction enzyme S subunit